VPKTCVFCNASSQQLLVKGLGTQQLVQTIQQLFPTARVARVDKDATVNKKKMQALFAQMHAREIDILIGTQMIAKGLHFPFVTLVGVIWADLHFNLPLFNATEVGIQQLIQVAGRAGRADLPGEVIIQSMQQHPALEFLSEERYQEFYTAALEQRALLRYPPCGRIAVLEFRHETETYTVDDSRSAAQLLKSESFKKFDLIVLGPAKPLVSKIKNVHSRTLLLKSKTMHNLYAAYQLIRDSQLQSELFFTPQPVQ